MNCKICECDLEGKGYFTSRILPEWSKNDSLDRGPFCITCTSQALEQMQILEKGGYEAHEAYMRAALGYTATEPYPVDIDAYITAAR